MRYRRQAAAGLWTPLSWLLFPLVALYHRLPDFPRKQSLFRRFSGGAGRVSFPSTYGVVLRNRPGDYTCAVAVLGTGGGRFVAAMVRQHLGSANFLDIGANQGLFSLVAAKVMKRGGHGDARVFSFEPNPFVFTTLCENIALNRARNVVPFCVALVDGEESFGVLSFRDGHSGGATLRRQHRQRVQVLCAGHQLLDRLADEVAGDFLVKIDVEGGENGVLAAIGRSRIADRVTGVIVELHPQHNTADELDLVGRQLSRMGLRETARSRPVGRCDAYFARA